MNKKTILNYNKLEKNKGKMNLTIIKSSTSILFFVCQKKQLKLLQNSKPDAKSFKNWLKLVILVTYFWNPLCSF